MTWVRTQFDDESLVFKPTIRFPQTISLSTHRCRTQQRQLTDDKEQLARLGEYIHILSR